MMGNSENSGTRSAESAAVSSVNGLESASSRTGTPAPSLSPPALDQETAEHLGGKVDSLLKGVMQLYLQVSTRLLELRVDKTDQKIGRVTNVDIVGPLGAQARRYAVAIQGGEISAAGPAESNAIAPDESTSDGEKTADRSDTPSPATHPTELPSELALQFSREPRAGSLKPPMGEQLRRRTFEYVNHALQLAKQGRVESAETYAKLAQAALATASAYLSAEEYLALTREVMLRVHPESDGSETKSADEVEAPALPNTPV
jgi:hypothetical protein